MDHQSADDTFTFLRSARKHYIFTTLREESPLDREPDPRRPISQIEVSPDEFKLLNSLRERGTSAIREQGINILFLAFGTLQWTDPNNGETLITPIALLPVSLVRIPGVDALQMSRIDGEVELNPTLVYRFGLPDINIQLPPMPEEEDFLPANYLQTVRETLTGQPLWTVSDTITLGRFSFLKMAMYRDLERQFERACSHPVIQALAGDTTALMQLLTISVPSLTEIDTETRGMTLYSVLDADPSQQRAILAAKRGQSFVLQGPPGTGKTQTIANIIAEGIADGKRVLFVSQKMAALDAVFKRLRDKRLHALCLEAHSHKTDKRQFVEQLRRAYEAQKQIVQTAPDERVKFDWIKQQLSDVAADLHSRRSPLQLSLYEVCGKIAAAENVIDLPFTFVGPDAVDEGGFLLLERLVERLASHHHLFSQTWTHPWRGILADHFTLELQTNVRTVLNDLIAAIVACGVIGRETAQLCGLEPPENLGQARHASVVAGLLASTPHPPEAWLIGGDMTELRTLASACQTRYLSYFAQRTAILETWSTPIFDLPHEQLSARLSSSNEGVLRRILGTAWQETASSDYQHIRSAIESTAELAQSLARSVNTLASMCHLEAEPTISNCRFLCKVSEIVSSDIRPQTNWFQAASLTKIKAEVAEATSIYQRYAANRESLFKTYSEELFSLDLSTLHTRFSTQYSGISRWFQSAFYRDRSAVLRCARPGGAGSGRSLHEDIGLAKQVVNDAGWIEQQSAALQETLGTHFRGQATNWADVSRRVDLQYELISTLPGQAVPAPLAETMIASGRAIEALAEIYFQTNAMYERFDVALLDLKNYLSLAELPFTDLPLTQVSLAQFRDWLLTVLAALDDYHAAYATVVACRSRGQSSSSTPVASFSVLSMLDALSNAAAINALESEIESESERLRQRYTGFFHGLETDWQAVLSGLDWCQRLRASFDGSSIPDRLVQVAVSGRVGLLDDVAKSRVRLESSISNLDRCTSGMERFLPASQLFVEETPLADASFKAVSEWVQKRLDRLSELEQWIDYQNLRVECERSGLLSFYETTVHRQPDAQQVVPAFRKRFFQLWYDQVCDTVPELRQFRGEQHAQLIAQFRAMDRGAIDTAPERVRAAVQSRASGHSLAVGQMGAFKKLLVSKRLRSIRRLLADIPDVLFQYKPCLLMSPLSVSLYLESGAFQFDTVIFDEASQVFIEDALCALVRANQVIIAGDTRQLPPTPFFKSLAEDPDEDEDSDEEAVASYESILQAAGLLAQCDGSSAISSGSSLAETRFAEHELTWHYRSRHESLIAFSKVHFYERIIPFPAPTAASAVTLVQVPDGIYYPGKGKRNNPREAEVVVAQVIDYMRANPLHSVGVITFNEAQKAVIEDLFEGQRRQDPELARLLNEEGSEGFFVKNIENVQGDERDAIFLSVCYARTPAGTVSMNFGPLNNDGGERRLNVAITRARIRMTVVTSMSATDIDPAKTNKVGPTRLREYLEYAQSGGLSLPGEQRAQSDFEQAIEVTLRRCGYTIKSNVGRFGHVVGLGVVRPDVPDEYMLGIETDGPLYVSGETVRARDRLRDEVLNDLGWRLHRVWSSDWIRNPARELSRVEDAIRASQVRHVETTEQAIHETLPESIQEVGHSESAVVPIVGNQREPTVKPIPVTPVTLEATQLLPGMAYYERSTPTVMWDRDRFYDTSIAAERSRADLLLQLLNIEGPLLYEEVVKRIPEAVGISRVGPRVRDIVEETIDGLINQGKLEPRLGFLYPTGIEHYPARIAKPGAPTRPIDQICLEEIGEVAILLLRASYGMRHDELVVELARLFGYRSTSANMRDHINDAIALLELDSRVEVRGGQILALELV